MNAPLALLRSLVTAQRLPDVVPLALDIIERDPLAMASCFPGDLLRGLMDVPGTFWNAHRADYERYRTALRSGAALRRRLPAAESMRFWSPLDGATFGEAFPSEEELPCT